MKMNILIIILFLYNENKKKTQINDTGENEFQTEDIANCETDIEEIIKMTMMKLILRSNKAIDRGRSSQPRFYKKRRQIV